MGVSPFAIFIKQNFKKFTGPVTARGKAMGKAYKALKPAEKAKLVAAAKAAPSFKRTKISASARKTARFMGVPIATVKKHYFSVQGKDVAQKIRAVADKAQIRIVKRRTPKQ